MSLLKQEATATHTFQGTTSLFPQITGREDRTIKGEMSTCRAGAKTVTVEACQSSLGKRSDWITGTTLEDL